ncbi:MAG: TolC family protein [Candidatus Sericytochromatia bacterium]
MTHRLIRLGAIGLFAMLWLHAPIALAAHAPQAQAARPAEMAPLRVLLREAAERHPGVAAARQRYEAALARVDGQGLYPDPMVEAGAMRLWGLMGPEIAVSQTFPTGGKLDTERRMAESEVEVARQAWRLAVNALLAEVRRTYYDLYFFQQSAAIVERNKQLLTQMTRIATARYAVGQGKQADVVRLNTQLAEMLHEAVLVRQQRESASAKLMGLLNRPFAPGHVHATEGAIPTPATAPYRLGATAAIQAAEARNPALLRARAEVASGEAALESARTLAAPDVTTRLGLSQAYMGMGWETVVSGMVGATVPVQGRRREAAAIAAAESELAARRSDLADRRREIHVGIQQALTHVRHLEEQVDLYTRGLLPQARQALQSELANYQVGRSDFDAVLTAQLAVYRYEREHQQAIADYQKMLAELDALTAEETP